MYGIGIGQSDFKILRIKKNYYIDKTKYIKDIIDNESSVVLITRPRRFGKTLNMSMLRYYFDCTKKDSRELFEGLEIMKQDEKFKRPIITFIDTPGAYPGVGAEERGQGEAIAKNIMEMSKLEVPIICIVIGEGSSGGALAIGVGDKIVMLENAVYSILSPEGFASILYKDASKAKEAAENMKITAEDLKKLEIIEKIIEEPEEGVTEKTLEKVCTELKKYLKQTILELQKENTEKLLERRYEKFRKIQ